MVAEAFPGNDLSALRYEPSGRTVFDENDAATPGPAGGLEDEFAAISKRSFKAGENAMMFDYMIERRSGDLVLLGKALRQNLIVHERESRAGIPPHNVLGIPAVHTENPCFPEPADHSEDQSAPLNVRKRKSSERR